MGRLTFRSRLTIIFGIGYLLTGMLTVAELLADVDVLPSDADAVSLPDGRPLSGLLETVRDETLADMLRTMLLDSVVRYILDDLPWANSPDLTTNRTDRP